MEEKVIKTPQTCLYIAVTGYRAHSSCYCKYLHTRTPCTKYLEWEGEEGAGHINSPRPKTKTNACKHFLCEWQTTEPCAFMSKNRVSGS